MSRILTSEQLKELGMFLVKIQLEEVEDGTDVVIRVPFGKGNGDYLLEKLGGEEL